jgi:RNA polymerase sigma-70 factor (ECF subfamily)
MNPLTQDEIIRSLFAHRARLSSAVWMVVRDVHLAEDVFQEVMVKAAARLEPFDHEAHLLAWSRVTGRHLALNLLRQRNRGWVVLNEETLDLLDADWASSPMPSARVEALQDCLETMPAGPRRMLDLRYAEGHSCEEVARTFGLNLDAAYQRLSRLHRALRDCVEQKLISVNNPGSPAI